MAELSIGKAPSNSAILPFYATGAIGFAVLCTVMLIAPDAFIGFYFSPHLLTMVHLAALGWGTMMIFGAGHQLLPVICEQNLYSEKLAAFSWYSLTLGVGLLTYGFWDNLHALFMISGGALVVFSAVLYSVNAHKTTEIFRKYSVQKLFINGSAFWLVFTTSVGLLLAINLKYPFITNKSHLEILKLHAHAGLVGWFLQLISGISSKLVPMFVLGKSSKDNLLERAFIFQNLGLVLFLVDGFFMGIGARAFIYLLLVLVGILYWLAYLYDAFKHRLRKKVELLMKHAAISIACLILAVLMVPLVYFSKGYQWTMLYGTILFMGWITSIILGKTFKTLPFIIWNNQYKQYSGKVKVPLPKDLFNEQLTKWQFWLFILAFLSFALGVVLQNSMIIRMASVVWLLVAIIYCSNVFILLTHKSKIKL
jgi:hypothetical protein